jgi:hypothetical protein
MISVLQTYRIVSSAKIFRPAASVPRSSGSWQQRVNAMLGDSRIGFGSRLNPCASAFICGFIRFGCGPPGDAPGALRFYVDSKGEATIDERAIMTIILRMGGISIQGRDPVVLSQGSAPGPREQIGPREQTGPRAGPAGLRVPTVRSPGMQETR